MMINELYGEHGTKTKMNEDINLTDHGNAGEYYCSCPDVVPIVDTATL